RSGRQDVTLNAFIISATPFNDLRLWYGEGSLDQKKFAEKHILFQERNADYDYIRLIFKE
ncbi:MAG: hypothetical protein D6715_06695, partial [Calditrichaeota bacterium]